MADDDQRGTDALQRAYADLESIVAERTAALAAANERLEREIAERRRNEDRLRDHEAEISHYHRLLTLGEMASGIAHELNQPLAAINNYAETCLDMVQNRQATSEEIEFAFKQVVNLAQRAGEIIRRLRALARKRESKRSAVDIAEMAREAMQYVEREAKLAEVEIHFDFDSQPAVAVADALQLQQVVINLARNGIQAVAAEPQRALRVFTRCRSGGLVEFGVCNSGPVIDPEILTHMFEPFFTTKPDGLGMGLAICRRIVESHRGTIRVESHAAEGTRFYCQLPAIEALNS